MRIPAGVDEALSRGPVGCAGLGRSVGIEIAVQPPGKKMTSLAALSGGERAMTAALSAGDLFGAGLDVFDEEPTPADNPLLKLDNVVLTAHLAGPTFESNITRLRNGFDNVQRVARGEPALWVVPELL